jgi:hypothetical protein
MLIPMMIQNLDNKHTFIFFFATFCLSHAEILSRSVCVTFLCAAIFSSPPSITPQEVNSTVKSLGGGDRF